MKNMTFKVRPLGDRIVVVEDALNATRAAIEEGIVPGGGVALLRCLSVLETLKLKDEDEQTGVNIVMRAIEEPTRALAQNAGVEGSVVVQEVKRRKGNDGYNVATGQYELLLTTECLVTDIAAKE